MSFVYFLQAGYLGPVKIGFTTQPSQRFSAIKTSNPAGLTLIRMIEGTRSTEKWLHERFSHAHKNGEWFSFDPDMLTVTAENKPEPKNRAEAEHDSTLLEAQEIVKAAGDRAGDGVSIGKRIVYAAERLGIQKGRAKRFWYLESSTISASEIDHMRRAYVDILQEAQDEIDRRAEWIKEKHKVFHEISLRNKKISEHAHA